VDLAEFDELVMGLPDVRRRSERGLWRWQYHGRLVARQVHGTAVVVRVPFDVRDLLVRQSPEVFSVPARFAKHMMVLAELSADDDGAVEEAVNSAWRLQSAHLPGSH